jgi:hypothetical protein
MFTDPQSVTIDGTAISLPRVSAGVNVGALSSNDGATKLDIAHSYGKRVRRTMAITVKKYATDAANPSQNIPVSSTVRITVDQPVQGYTVDELKAVIVGFFANLTASSNANIVRLLGGEN